MLQVRLELDAHFFSVVLWFPPLNRWQPRLCWNVVESDVKHSLPTSTDAINGAGHVCIPFRGNYVQPQFDLPNLAFCRSLLVTFLLAIHLSLPLQYTADSRMMCQEWNETKYQFPHTLKCIYRRRIGIDKPCKSCFLFI